MNIMRRMCAPKAIGQDLSKGHKTNATIWIKMLCFKKDHGKKIVVAEMHMFRWMSGIPRREKFKNKDIRKALGVANFVKKMK